MTNELSRREWLTASPAAIAAGTVARAADSPREPFGYCLNTSTVRGQKLSIVEVVELASRAGYNGLEPWLEELERYAKGGGGMADLGKRLRDRGLSVESSIAFHEWVVDDETRRKKGLEGLKRSMDVIRQIGGKRIAAPPAGATNQANLSLARAAEYEPSPPGFASAV